MTRFDARDYRFWFVSLTDRLGLGWLGGAIAAGLVPYLLGLALVAPFGEAGLYLRTPAFYIGLGGVALVMAAAVQGVKVLASGLSDLQEVARDHQSFHDYADRQLSAAAKDRANIGALAIVFAGAITVVAAALGRWDQSGVVRAGHHFHAFPVEWRAPSALVPAGLALGVFAIATTATFGSSVILLVRNLVFAWRLREFQYLPFPGQVRLAIRRLVAAYAWVSGTWAIGVALFVLFFFENWSAADVAGIAALAALGVLSFAIPYDSFRRILDRTHDEMASFLVRKVDPIRIADAVEPASMAELAAINTAIAADPPPVLTRRGAIAYGAVQVLAFGSIFAKSALQEQVTFLARGSSDQSKPKR